jgi:hypothetical protein
MIRSNNPHGAEHMTGPANPGLPAILKAKEQACDIPEKSLPGRPGEGMVVCPGYAGG